MITVSLVKNLKKGCHHPCLVVFVDSKEKKPHYFRTEKESAVQKFITTFKTWMQWSVENSAYVYKSTGFKEIASRCGIDGEEANEFWTSLIKEGWRPIKKENT